MRMFYTFSFLLSSYFFVFLFSSMDYKDLLNFLTFLDLTLKLFDEISPDTCSES